MKTRRLFFKRILPLMMVAVMTFTSVPANIISRVTGSNVADMASVSAASNAEANNLTENITDGAILHCWCWSFKTIKENMADIAAAGYSTIQTSPANTCKATYPNMKIMGSDEEKGTDGVWWWHYQPTDWKIGNYQLGTRDDFKAMCEEADKYGIKVIVDVIPNHTTPDLAVVSQDLYNAAGGKDKLYHANGFNEIRNYSDRWQCTTGAMSGLPSVNTENKGFQAYFVDYLNDLIECGCDGFRYDTAKHIGVPSDPKDANSQENDFWDIATGKKEVNGKKLKNADKVFTYGEVLQDNGIPYKEYASYMYMTASKYGDNLRDKVKWKDFSTGAIGDWIHDTPNRIVTWVESHDTYCNAGESVGLSKTQIRLAWAVVAARKNGTPLFYSRPDGSDGWNNRWGKNVLGAKGDDEFKSPEVAAVNFFRNAMVGEGEYLRNPNGSNQILQIDRGKKGTCIINLGGPTDINSETTMADGTYVDQVSKREFTVSGGKISGHLDGEKVAVIYNAGPVVKTPAPTISKEGGNFSTETLELTIGLRNASKGTYKIGSDEAKEYTGDKKITIGSGMEYGESVTVTLTATDGSQTETKTYKFTKVEQTGDVVYLSLPSGWSKTVYCYAYVPGGTPAKENAKWPGVEMTLDTASGYYKYEIPDDMTEPKVILHDGSDNNRTSQEGEPEQVVKGSWLYKDGSWSEYSPTPPQPDKGTVTVKYVDESGEEIAETKTLTGNVGSGYKTSAATVSGYTLMGIPSNEEGKYTKDPITVTYKYMKNGNEETPTVTSSLAEGSTFKTETAKITLTLQNAESGTYSVDDGPVRTFTGSAEVVIGQGKVADSTITVKATAKSGTETKDYTFTYKKQFDKTVDETVKALQANTAGNAFADKYYKINPSGTGSEKTITSASDWTASELICQGVANDDSNVFKGPHELPVYDEYALYAAYDDTNLYIGWQYVNVRDVVAPDQADASTGQSKAYIAPIPQMLVFDLGSSKGAYGNGDMVADSDDKKVWGIDVGYETNVNAMLCFSSKHDGTPAVFTTDSSGKFSYDKEHCKEFKSVGVSYEWEDGLFAGISSLYGINKNGYTGYETDMLFSNSSEWVDLSSGHNKDLDTFYTITIPYSALNISKDYLKSNGIGVMHISTFGESGVACIPADESMYDVAKEAYSQDDSSTREKEDSDIITAPLARIGKEGGPTPPIPPTPDSLELNFGADRSSPQTAATALSLKGIAKGGTAPYTYKFYVNDKLVEEKSGSGEVSVNWTPAAGNEQIIKCQVTDSKDNTVRSAKFYTIEGKEEGCTHSKTIVNKREEPTCTKAGHEEETVCADCGEVIVPGEIIPAKGHNWVSGECTECGEKQPIDCKHSNRTVKAKKEATCTETGHEEETVCADCGEVIVPGEIIPAKGHTWSSGVCTVCGAEQLIGCNHSNTKVQGAKEATCTKDGYTGDTVCTDCIEVIAKGTVIPAKGHTWSSGVCTVCGAEQPVDCNHSNKKVRGAKEATCTEDGYTGDTVCMDCGNEIAKGTVIPAKGHNWVLGVCTVCNAKQDDVTIDVTVVDTDIVYNGEEKMPQVIVKAGNKLLTKNVDYTVSYNNNTNAGKAYVIVTCKGNYTGTIEKTFTIAKAKAPAGTPGTEKSAPKSAEKVSDIKLSAGWKWSDKDADKELKTGVTVTATAVYEGEDRDNFETVSVPVQITKSDCEHPYDKIKTRDDREATCTEPGYTGDKWCEDCGKKVENGTEIKAGGHSWGDGRVTKEPTATEKGQMTYRCTRCTATKTEELSPIGSCQHPSTELRNTKAATCTEKGYSGDSYCKACGDLVKKGNDIPATGHSWDAGKVTKAPTATEKGVKTYTCTKCRNTRTEEIPATGGSSISQPHVITVPGNVEKGDSVEDTATNSVYMVTSKGLTSKTVKYVVTGSEKDTLVVPDSVSINGEAYKVTAVAGDAFKGNDTAKKIVVGDNVKTIGSNAFSDCKNLTQVTLGKNVTTIDANAFSNCKKMTKITLGKNVTTIGKNAFGGCTMLSSVTLPSKLSKIEEKAFYKCTKLKSITIPAKVKKIGKNAFYGCKNLKKITIKTAKLTKKNVGSNAFKGINSKATIKVPKKKLTSYKKMLRARGVGSKAKIKK